MPNNKSDNCLLCAVSHYSPVSETCRGKALPRRFPRRLLRLKLTSGLLTIQRLPRPESPILPASFI